ncbi:S-adenosyl-L-methionine-dependent methyltransferase [Linderina pennispora]|uniref:rRNA adenine N(6)-methyltransferase n=1 Tax=Linderina pennispora TaxID=61395 RepID=A0A1Y1WMM1_9FUNG|nr:S-adenosyl-L-methionine-dependent methyltransferase [Linderina pennispora]ORX74817.1 S-adenosyl-L-methionine-dependent methyltransferase [Linderina pennispora]
MATKLPKLPSIRDLIRLYDLRAKQQLSQNFIMDKNITDKILDNALCVEQLQEASMGRFSVILGDMLEINHSEILKRADGEFSHWLKMVEGRQGIFNAGSVSMSLMFQKEVGQRIAAAAGEPMRGRLSVVAQALCDAYEIYRVPASGFVPRPKVDATVVQLRPLEQPLLQSSLGSLERVVRFAFMKRRKMLARIFKDWDASQLPLLEECGIDPRVRPQDVTTAQFCHLAQLIEQRQIRLPC